MPQKIWTPAELDEMSPVQRERLIADSIIWHLGDAPTSLVERAQATARKRIAESEGKQTS